MVLLQDKEKIRNIRVYYCGFFMQYCAKIVVLRRFITVVHRPLLFDIFGFYWDFRL